MHIYKLIGLITQVQAKVIMIKAIWPFIIQLLTIYETKMALVHTSRLWTNRLHVQVHNTMTPWWYSVILPYLKWINFCTSIEQTIKCTKYDRSVTESVRKKKKKFLRYIDYAYPACMHGFRVVSGITTPSPTRWGFSVCRGNPYRKQKYEMPLSLTCLTNVCYFSETKHIAEESTCNLLSLTIRILNAYQLYFTIKYY